MTILFDCRVRTTTIKTLAKDRNMTNEIQLTADSLETFLKYVRDAGNWDYCPWISGGNVECTKAMRGNISDLVQKGLILTHDHEGMGRAKDMYLTFTETGRQLAAKHGHDSIEVNA